MTAFPGTAEIRYYLKVTVNRKEFYRENPRHVFDFTFLPVEPPRQTQLQQAEVYARRRHDFALGKETRRSLLDTLKGRSGKSPAEPEGTPPCVIVDARLPNPPILTCNRDVPMRIIIKRQANSPHAIYLHSISIILSGHTRIRAQDVLHEAVQTWVLFTRTNIHMMLFPESTSSGGKKGLAASMGEGAEEEMQLDLAAVGWELSKRRLPNSVAPSFDTCNIRRLYELDVEVGIGWGDQASSARNVSASQLCSSRYRRRLTQATSSTFSYHSNTTSKYTQASYPHQKSSREASAAHRPAHHVHRGRSSNLPKLDRRTYRPRPSPSSLAARGRRSRRTKTHHRRPMRMC